MLILTECVKRSLKFLLNGHVSVQLPLIEILKGVSGFYVLPFLLLKPVNQDDPILWKHNAKYKML